MKICKSMLSMEIKNPKFFGGWLTTGPFGGDDGYMVGKVQNRMGAGGEVRWLVGWEQGHCI